MSEPGQGKPLRIEDRERVRWLRFDRPEALNAFNDHLYDAVREALVEAEQRADIAAVVLTGTGRAFSAGQDLGELAEPRARTDDDRHGFVPFIEVVESFSKPLIAAVNGLAVGIGVTLLPHCDLVFVARGARLRTPFARLGVTTEAGSSLLLPARIGWQATALMLFTAGWMSAEEAERCGLAWRLCEPENLLEEVGRTAAEIAAMPVESLVATKRLLLEARLPALREARARELESFGRLLGGPANREALAAFRERREPNFASPAPARDAE